MQQPASKLRTAGRGALLLYALLLLVVSLYPNPTTPNWVSDADRLAHFAAYAVLGLLLAVTLAVPARGGAARGGAARGGAARGGTRTGRGAEVRARDRAGTGAGAGAGDAAGARAHAGTHAPGGAGVGAHAGADTGVANGGGDAGPGDTAGASAATEVGADAGVAAAGGVRPVSAAQGGGWRAIWWRYAATFMATAAYGVVLEFLQQFTGRSPELGDTVANLLGGATGVGTVALGTWRLRRRPAGAWDRLSSR